jgi:hypothetical protein
MREASIDVTMVETSNCYTYRYHVEALHKYKSCDNMYPNIFWLGCLVHTMNLLMHDIIKMKDHDYRWIGDLYKRRKKMIKYITNHTMAHLIFHNHYKSELLKIVADQIC